MRRKNRYQGEFHPTKQQLIDTVELLLQSSPVSDLTSDLVLEASQISKGSLYHHFEDFPDLINTTLVLRFSRYVDEVLDELLDAIEQLSEINLARMALYDVAARVQVYNSRQMRMERIWISTFAESSPKLQSQLEQAQDKLTQRWMEIFQLCLDRGWAAQSLDPRAVAVLLQTTIVGRVVDDVASEHMDQGEWVKVLQHLHDSLFFAKLTF